MKPLINVLAAIALVTWGAGVVAEVLTLYTINYPPFQYQEGNEVKGMMPAIVKEAFRRSERDVTIEVIPWPRVLRAAQDGEVDGLFTVFRTAERERYLDYCHESLIDQHIVMFVKKDSLAVAKNGNAALADLRLGLVNQISYGPIFDQQVKAGKYQKIEMSNNFEEAVKKFGAARFDVLVASEYVGKFYLQRQNLLGQVRQLPQVIDTVPSYLAFSKARRKNSICEVFDKVLREMKQDGSYQAIMDSYIRRLLR
ncbi:ABC transporter substrate-binding protein [Pseudogulbenkiania sp. MAI-1]|uniref:substrate-binding periplasmic protein n=1 Tax=Pseudogulbenkiania sp. MAI-1 TaxID=990370 RepID=UPI00045EC546|nr:transporter substrate-binding domain-containing protein [Pseudogulbenkiania sp. MAI-1]